MKKPAVILISIAAAFMLIMGGFFIGRISKDGSIGIYTQRSIFSEIIQKNNSNSVMVNINTATAEELQDLPGIGPTTAKAIIEYREENGPFERKSEIMNVTGIGNKTYDEIKSFITVDDD